MSVLGVTAYFIGLKKKLPAKPISLNNHSLYVICYFK